MNYIYGTIPEHKVSELKREMCAELLTRLTNELQIQKPTLEWFSAADDVEASFRTDKPILGSAHPKGRILVSADETLEKTAEVITHEIFHVWQFSHESARFANSEDLALKYGQSSACRDVVERFMRLEYRINNTKLKMA